MTNPLYDFFPKTSLIKIMRSNQKEALDKIWIELESDHKNITIIAPTGAGKCAIFDTLANYYNSLGKSCLYCSPLNSLVDQVESSGFKEVATLKGRSNYRCIAGKDNCEEGYCQLEKCPSSKRKRDCKHKPYGACDNCVCWRCLYKIAYNKFKVSHKGNTNFSLLLLGIDNNPDVIATDEADTIEGFIRMHNSVTIPILINDPVFVHHIKPLQEYLEVLSLEIDELNPDDSRITEEQLKERKKLQRLYDKITDLLYDVEKNLEPWCVTVNIIDRKTKYEPITIERFLDPLLENKIVFMMSATPPIFPGYKSIEVGSIFPKNTRHWEYNPLGKMSMDYRDNTIPSVAWWLSQLKGKTLVHCVSYKTAEKISDALRVLGINSLLQVNHNNGDEHCISRYDAVEAFVSAKDTNKILLSVKLDRGIDFWQPEIINNVICVMPFPNPTEPLTKAKNKLLPESWQNEQMARDIAQAYGRIHRNECFGTLNGIKVPKKTYIIDSNFRKWYSNNSKLFPVWFKEAKLK